MKKILGILPHSIGGRLTTSSILDGFKQNDFEVIIFDELKNNNFDDFLKENYNFIVGYDFSPIKLKIDYSLKTPCIAYFSDVIQEKTSGVGYKEYYKYLKNNDIFVFYWDRELAKQEKCFYLPHFVNTEIYKNYLNPKYDVMFMGRLDTDLRLDMFLNLNKLLPQYSFVYYGIEKHCLDALSRCKTNEDKNILKKAYKGFIDNEKDMAQAINETKIVYNINAQGKTSLNYRTIQTLACKRLLISDRREELDLFNNIIPIYKNTKDLAQQIDFYLKNNNEYEKITTICEKLVQASHNSKNSVEKILSMINA